MTPVVYISGTGRSGTNILKEILGRHSKIATLPFEHRFTVDPDGLADYYSNIENWSPYMADHRLRSLGSFLRRLAKRDTEVFDESEQLKTEGKTGHPYAGWELDKWIPGYSQYVDELMDELTTFRYKAAYPGSAAAQVDHEMMYARPDIEASTKAISKFLDRCHMAIAKQQSKSIFLEDNTWSILYADVLYKLTPHGKLIHMVRDPRDVISSMQKQRWTPTAIEHVSMYYEDLMDRWQLIRKKLPSVFYMEVRFEDLIKEPKYTVQRITDFIGVEDEQSMYEVDLSHGNIGRYKEELTAEETSMIRTQLDRYFQQYQYN